MTGAVAEPVTTETEVTEAGSQPVAVVVQEDSGEIVMIRRIGGTSTLPGDHFGIWIWI